MTTHTVSGRWVAMSTVHDYTQSVGGGWPCPLSMTTHTVSGRWVAMSTVHDYTHCQWEVGGHDYTHCQWEVGGHVHCP